ncbi:energy transducer TonB [Hyphomicrobium sp. xq]|uniref:Energy transducer TonB n=1 Tax=Hyphomicrobium album TaxID=2665159 RepID=A0A6I3KPR9_9HYPH|nr:STN domain-containing protein [Hyphomicrobium album]MTD96298.1 energy transducer TonB [Hyphomicrobium album]
MFAQALGAWLCRRMLACVTCVAALHLATGSPFAYQPSTRTISFDIPSQPLAQALEDYVAATGLEVFYDSDLASGRRSTAVAGHLAADVALRVLLEGTDLTALYATNAFSVVPAAPVGPGGEGLVSHPSYLALIQRRIEQAFCRRAVTMPGSYRLAVRFRIGMEGEVLQPELLSTSGSADRDGAIAAVLGGVHIGSGPPSGMPQPIVMLVKPLPPSQTGDCLADDHRASVRP